MNRLEQTIRNQLDKIAEETGKSLVDLRALAEASGLSKHRKLRKYFKKELGLGYSDANALAHFVRRPEQVKK